MQIPTFPECDHDLVKSLIHLSDYALVNHLQKSPNDGKYFTALFCRYSPVVYSLIRHSARSPVQADYLFAITWRHILNELGGIALPAAPATSAPTDNFSLQGWLISLTAAYINQAKLPSVEDIHYSLQNAPPPLWCYTERALDRLLPQHRLILLMSQTFQWSETRIAAYLQAEGEQTSPQAVGAELKVASQALEQALPEDMRAIYLDHPPVIVATDAEAMAGLLTIEFDEFDLQSEKS